MTLLWCVFSVNSGFVLLCLSIEIKVRSTGAINMATEASPSEMKCVVCYAPSMRTIYNKMYVSYINCNS